MSNDDGRTGDGREPGIGAEESARRAEDPEIHVSESDITNLTLLDRSDTIFAVLYGVLFVWGLILTLLAI